jgi:UDP-N-acetylmuramoyl-tripeptide--D-alanyl-D-alanine ligase
LKADGPVVANADDPEVMRISRRSGHELITYGIKNEADIRIISHQDLGIDGVEFRVNIYGKEFDARLELPGVHNLYNALAALGAGISMRMSPEAIIERLNHVELSPIRSHIVRLPQLTLYDDAYNSNPEALRRVIDTAVKSRVPGRRIVVAGDMLELGESEVAQHEQCGRYIARSGIDRLLTVGKLAGHIGAAALKEGMPSEAIEIFKSSDEATKALEERIGDGDLLVIKGSRGSKLEIIVEAIMKRYSS